jgi:hypothetical protein
VCSYLPRLQSILLGGCGEAVAMSVSLWVRENGSAL